MFTIILASVLGFAVAIFARKISAARSNREIARSSGFPTYLSPVHITDFWWLATQATLAPYVRLLPSTWREPWLSLSEVFNAWKYGHRVYAATGTDTIVLATPSGNMLWTCDPPVVEQIFSQHGKTQIPVDMVKFYDFWGPNLGSLEGDEWRKHRRIVTQGFNPTTNAAVWSETLKQVTLLLNAWEAEGNVVQVVKDWTSRLALHVFSGVLFHRPLDWREYSAGTSKPEEGHKMSFETSLFTIIAKMGVLVLFPRPLLRILPIESLQDAVIAYDEWTGYLKEMRQNTLQRLDSIVPKKYKTILESIVLAGTPQGTKAGETPITEQNVMGDMFFLLFTGHETAGNTLAFILLLLAIYPDWQEKVHAELTTQLGDRPQASWTLEKDFPALQSGLTGAVQKEILRLYHVVQFIPRIVKAPTTVVDSKGVTHTIPVDTLCLLNFPAAFRNDSVWTEPAVFPQRKRDLHASPALCFDPGRWLRDDAVEKREVVPKWYWPFGIGARACPGKAFALTEMTAAMAAVLMGHRLELVVSEEMLAACGRDKMRAWEETRDGALRMMYDDIVSNVSTMLLKPLPLKVVKR